MENIQEQARFLFHDGGDTTINLIPAFSAYLLGVAAFAVLGSQLVNTDLLSPRSAAGHISQDTNPPVQDITTQQQQYIGEQQQYYQPTATGQQLQQQQYYQPQPVQQQQYQAQYYQQQQQYGQTFDPSLAEKQDFVNSQEQIDIYQKLLNLQEELRKLQEAEQLLSTALSRRYTSIGQ